MKRAAIGVMIVIAMLVTAWLSLIRTRHVTDDASEIKHFRQTPAVQDLRLSDGRTLEEFYDKKIHLRMRPRPASSQTPMKIEVSSPQHLPEGVQMGEPLRHTLQENETLADLAKRYQLSEYQIRKLNQLDEEAIPQPGSKLRIVPGLKPTYRVRPGDTLIAIGKRFGVDHREIIRLNELEGGESIWAGQKLMMPIPQKEIDTILTQIEKKKREEEARKRRYERELIARLARQKMLRKQEEKRKAEEAERQRKQAEAAQKAKAAKAKQDRLSKARRAFKYTGSKKYKHKIHVVATAYTSHRSQTDNTPFLAAWNNRIRPGMKIIAVSPDLIRRYGLTNGVRVKIGGLPGTYVVRDKMNPRLRNHIDIYMGLNRRRALRWGRRRVVLYW